MKLLASSILSQLDASFRITRLELLEPNTLDMPADDEPTSSYKSRHSDRHPSHRRSHRDHDDFNDPQRRRSQSPPPQSTSINHAVLDRFGVPPLTADEYFIRSSEFKAWLSTKSRYLDEISSKDARRYFDRFVRRWNSGRLEDEYYTGTVHSGPSISTRHRWGFTRDVQDEHELALIRDNVDTLTNGDSKGAVEARRAERRLKHSRSSKHDDNPAPAPSKRDSGWSARASTSTGKSPAETRYDREHEHQLSQIAATEQRRKARQDALDVEESLYGRATGHERMLEKKRQINASNREFADRKTADDGFELDDRELYDQDPPSRANGRERTKSKREQARQERAEQRKAEMQDRLQAVKDKDAKTMDMLRALAQERFGGGDVAG